MVVRRRNSQGEGGAALRGRGGEGGIQGRVWDHPMPLHCGKPAHCHLFKVPGVQGIAVQEGHRGVFLEVYLHSTRGFYFCVHLKC